MNQLESWKASELRRLAGDFRTRAAQTGLPHYIELMLFTAQQLDAEADRMEHRAGPGHHISILV